MPDIEAPGENTPLVQGEDALAAAGASENEPPPLKDLPANSLKEKLVSGGAVVAFSASVASIVVERHPIVYGSGLLGAGVAPLAAIQQSKLTQCEALRETNQRISEEVDQLKEENVRLQDQVGKLESSVKNLEEMQKTLETVRAVEGQSMDELERQLEESEKILDQMEDNLAGEIVQTLISVVLAINNDGDSVLSDEEIDLLIIKIEKLQGIDLNEDMLRTKLIENGRSLNAVIDVISNLLNNETPPEERMFNFINKK